MCYGCYTLLASKLRDSEATLATLPKLLQFHLNRLLPDIGSGKEEEKTK